MEKRSNLQSSFKKAITLTKRASVMTLVATLALSMPSIANRVSEVSPGNSLQMLVAHAESLNLMIVDDDLTGFTVDHHNLDAPLVHHFQNSGEIISNGATLDLTDLTYVVKFPEKLSHLLNDQDVLNDLFRKEASLGKEQNSFAIEGDAIDENGEHISLNNEIYSPYEYIRVNKDTKSIEFDINHFYKDNELQPIMTENSDGTYSFNTLTFITPIHLVGSEISDKDAYLFKSAILRGKSIDLNMVSSAHTERLVVDVNQEEMETEQDIQATKLEEPLENVKKLESKSDTTLSNQSEVSKENLDDNETISDQEEVEWDDELEDYIDKGELARYIGIVDNDYNREHYTSESFNDLIEVREIAGNVLTSDKASQEDVDQALASLKAAIDGLKEAEEQAEALETDSLESLIKEAKALNAANYTEISFKNVLLAIEVAESILKNEEADQERINAALSTLDNTMKTLIRIDESTGSVTSPPNRENNTDIKQDVNTDIKTSDQAINQLSAKEKTATHTETNEGAALPQTATSTYNMLLVGFLALMTGGITLIMGRRKKLG